MNGVIGFLQLLQTTELTTAQQEYARLMRFSAENLLNIIGDILDISKIEAGAMLVENCCFRIDELLEMVIKISRPQAEDKGLTFMDRIAPDLNHSLTGDPIKIKQILINLLSNGIKFTSKGSITISADHLNRPDNSHWIRFMVTDTGCGIPKEKLDEVFEPFVQADGSMTRSFGGTGLGLAICRRLATLMGGEITAKSRQGQGSCFILDLPLQTCDAVIPKAPELTPLPVGWNEKPLKILVVDDHDLNRQLTCKLVEVAGHKTTQAVSGPEAIEQWKQGGFDIILMDLEMPDMDGALTTKIIRESEEEQKQGTHIPIIALTAHALSHEKERAQEAGMDGYVTKPVMLGDLLLEIRKVLA